MLSAVSAFVCVLFTICRFRVKYARCELLQMEVTTPDPLIWSQAEMWEQRRLLSHTKTTHMTRTLVGSFVAFFTVGD